MTTPEVAARTISRAQVCGRITALRDALDLLVAQAAVDRHGAFACRGPMKAELIGLERKLREMDGPVSAPPHVTMLADAIVAHQGSRRVG